MCRVGFPLIAILIITLLIGCPDPEDSKCMTLAKKADKALNYPVSNKAYLKAADEWQTCIDKEILEDD